jgi:uncharacterized membrane protein
MPPARILTFTLAIVLLISGAAFAQKSKRKRDKKKKKAQTEAFEPSQIDKIFAFENINKTQYYQYATPCSSPAW